MSEKADSNRFVINLLKKIVIVFALMLFFALNIYAFIYDHINKRLAKGEFAEKMELSLILESVEAIDNFEVKFKNYRGSEEEINFLKNKDKALYTASISDKVVEKLSFKWTDKSHIEQVKAIKFTIGGKEYNLADRLTNSSTGQISDGGKSYILSLSGSDFHEGIAYPFKELINWGAFRNRSIVRILVFGLLRALIYTAILAIMLFFYKPLLTFFKNRNMGPVVKRLKPYQKQLILLLGFLILAVAIRFFTFHRIIHVDEPTYLVVADRVLKGDGLYVGVWDTKAPLFLSYYVIVMALFKSLVGIRFAGALVIGATGFFIFNILRILTGKGDKEGLLQAIPLVGGVSYLFISVLHIWSFWINPEQIVAFFSSLALLIILADKRYSVFLGSLMLGFSFMTKYPAGMDYALFALLWFILKLRTERRVSFYLKNIGLSLSGFIIPMAAVVLWYLIRGNLPELWEMFYTVTFKYPTKKSMEGVIATFSAFFSEHRPAVFLSITGAFCLLLSRKYKVALLTALLWAAATIICILSPGTGFSYYWFQFLPITAILTGFIIPYFEKLASFFLSRKSGFIMLYLLLIIFFTDIFMFTRKEKWKGEEPFYEVAEYLKPRLSENDIILAQAEGSQVLYYLLDKRPLTRYVHPQNNWGGIEEYRRIAVMKPLYIVNPFLENGGFWSEEIKKHYILEHNIERHTIYRRVD